MDALGAALRRQVGPPSGSLSPEELVSNAAVIMFGGIETTEGMILNLLWHVLGDEGVRRQLLADPALAAAAVEESLRLEPAAAVVDRYATRDTVVAGAPVAAGDLVTVSLAGANRDPAEFPDPDRFDLRRPNVRRHLAFATGPHVCIGIDLARLEAQVALTELLARHPDIRLEPGAPAPVGLVFRKPPALPVTTVAEPAPRSLP
jgi:cytochrome P450